MNKSPIKRVIVISDNPDLHPVILEGLSPQLLLPVAIHTTLERKNDNDLLNDSLIVTSLYHFLSV